MLGDDPDLGWRVARPGGLVPGTQTPGLAFPSVGAPSTGAELVFFWDTDADLADLERDVELRFTPIDPVVEGMPARTAPFRVDNNEEPIVQLDSGPLIQNPDERRGIPIPFRVIDEEGDLVEVIFQWRREGEEFPSLDRDGDGKVENAEVDEILADPVLRQEHHVCTPYPHYAKGRVVPVDEDTVRLPELASSESWILASGLEGRTLELLRPSSIPAPITPTWRSNPLVSPIAALVVPAAATLEGASLAAVLFGESASRAVVSVRPDDRDALLRLARELGVPAVVVGRSGGSRVRIDVAGRRAIDCDLAAAEHVWTSAIERHFAGRAA